MWGTRFGSAFRMGLVLALALFLIAGGIGAALAPSLSAMETKDAPGAAAGPSPVQQVVTRLTPEIDDADGDRGDVYQLGCQADYGKLKVRPCTFDYRHNGKGATVVAVGDSKAAQFVPALQVIAQEQQWRLITMTKAGCAFSDIRRATGSSYYKACVTWQRDAVKQIRKLQPTLVVTTQLDVYPTLLRGKALTGMANKRELVRGLSVRLRQMNDVGVRVMTIAETPRLNSHVPDCVRRNRENLTRCATPKRQAFAGAGVIKAASKANRVPMANVTARLCSDICPPVIGDVLVYRDDHHVTATFSRTLAPYLQKQMNRVLPDPLLNELFS